MVYPYFLLWWQQNKVTSSLIQLRLHDRIQWSVLAWSVGFQCFRNVSISIIRGDVIQAGLRQTNTLCKSKVCVHNIHCINTWWWGQRQSQKHEVPAPHWHSWSPEKTSLYQFPLSVICYDFPQAETTQCQCTNNINKCDSHKIIKLGMAKMGNMRTSLEVLMCAWKLKAFTECYYDGVNKTTLLVYFILKIDL
jgi:hypothetical protein